MKVHSSNLTKDAHFSWFTSSTMLHRKLCNLDKYRLDFPLILFTDEFRVSALENVAIIFHCIAKRRHTGTLNAAHQTTSVNRDVYS